MHKPDSPLGTRLFMAFIVSMMSSGMSVSAQEAAQPRLVLGIMVDDLQEEYINLLRQYFGTGGFNRLLKSGIVLSNVDYGSPMDQAAATAMIYTGASAAVNGIPADEIFDRATLHGIPVLTDKDYIGNYTDQTLSPHALLTSTITDEIRIAGNGMTYAYAIAPDATQSIIMAGHAGNSGAWINDANLAWATTTYYKDVPRVYNDRNHTRPLSSRIDSLTWVPSHSSGKYMMLPQHVIANTYAYTYNKKGPETVMAFKSSPLVNTEVTNFAIDHINSLSLGSHDGTDMLNLSYTLEPYAYSRSGDNRFELIDAYYRLDRDLERLFEVIDKKVGWPNTLIFIASTPPSQKARRDDVKWQIPYGEFSTRKAMSLLNLYFMATYGNGNWVQGFHNGEFFLNHELIKNSNLNLSDIRQEAASFLIQMEGVGSAYSLDDIMNGRAGIHASSLKQNTNIALAGDVRIKVFPGWELLDDFNHPTAKPNQVAREAANTAPVIIMAPGLAPRTIGEIIDARAIAPTICRLLRIRSPNAATLPPLNLEQ